MQAYAGSAGDDAPAPGLSSRPPCHGSHPGRHAQLRWSLNCLATQPLCSHWSELLHYFPDDFLFTLLLHLPRARILPPAVSRRVNGVCYRALPASPPRAPSTLRRCMNTGPFQMAGARWRLPQGGGGPHPLLPHCPLLMAAELQAMCSSNLKRCLGLCHLWRHLHRLEHLHPSAAGAPLSSRPWLPAVSWWLAASLRATAGPPCLHP